MLTTAGPTLAQAPPPLSVQVLHAAGEAVYVDGGTADGIEIGSHLQVIRDGEPIALVEIVVAYEHIAFCRLVHAFLPIVPGDLAVPSTWEEVTVSEDAPRLPAPDVPRGLSRIVERERRASDVYEPSFSGTAYLRSQWRQAGGDGGGRTWNDSTARISFVGRDLLHQPLTFRMRARERSRSRGDGDRSSDLRVYELSLDWNPVGSRTWVQLGRIGSRQEVGVGYLDGLAGQLQLGRRWGVGGFAGLEGNVDTEPFSSSRTKAGAFVTWASQRTSGFYGEVLASGIGEYGREGVSREYLFLRSRLGNRARWSLYQQAEVDLNRDWRRELAGSSTQLSNVSLALSVRLTERFRASVSYDARRRYRDDDSRSIPEEEFDRRLRNGLRGILYFQGWSGLAISFGAATRGGEGDVQDVNSILLSVNHPRVSPWHIFLGADVSTYRGDTGNGTLAALRARKGFRQGHDVGVELGWLWTTSDVGGETERSWVRLGGTYQLPFRLFVLAEVELGLGAGAEHRQMIQMGSRF